MYKLNRGCFVCYEGIDLVFSSSWLYDTKYILLIEISCKCSYDCIFMKVWWWNRGEWWDSCFLISFPCMFNCWWNTIVICDSASLAICFCPPILKIYLCNYVFIKNLISSICLQGRSIMFLWPLPKLGFFYDQNWGSLVNIEYKEMN